MLLSRRLYIERLESATPSKLSISKCLPNLSVYATYSCVKYNCQKSIFSQANFVLSQMDHPVVVRLVEIFDAGEIMYLVMELMEGGELFDRIVEKESYSEKEASETIKPIVDAIRYCHDNGIIHRDLKPENLLYQNSEETSSIKISDFGLARFIYSD